MVISFPWKTKKEKTSAKGRKKAQQSSLAPSSEAIKGKNAKEVITQVAKQQQRPEEKAVETKQFITFDLDKEEYAIPILDLREIRKPPEIISVPAAPPFVKGIFNLRGQIVLVIDLEKRVALSREHPIEPRHVIVLEVGSVIFGVMVDEVTGVLRVPVTSIKTTPLEITSKVHADYLNGVIVFEESREMEKEAEVTPEQIKKRLKTRLLLLLDLPKILSEKELLGFGNHVRQVVEETKPD